MKLNNRDCIFICVGKVGHECCRCLEEKVQSVLFQKIDYFKNNPGAT